MWRFGIAAFLLLVLFVLVGDMFFGGPGSAGGSRSYLPSYWYSALTNEPEAEDPARSRLPQVRGGQTPDDRTAQKGASRSEDVSQSQGQSVARKPDKASLPSSNMLSALPRPGDVLVEESTPAYTRFEETVIVTGPAARRAEAPASRGAARDMLRDSPIAERRQSHGAAATRLNREAKRGSTKKATARKTAEVQSMLAALGYHPGPADGRIGRQTEAAVREFERDARMPVSGRIDDRLLAILSQEASARAQSRLKEIQGMSASMPKTEQSERRGIFGSLLGGLQRLLGRDFDSIRRPDELTAYCRANASNWIYDFGREAFVYCGNIIAGQLSDHAAGPAPEGPGAY